jgi:hypothetical protein
MCGEGSRFKQARSLVLAYKMEIAQELYRHRSRWDEPAVPDLRTGSPGETKTRGHPIH